MSSTIVVALGLWYALLHDPYRYFSHHVHFDRHTGQSFDKDGATAALGTVNKAILEKMLSKDYFDRPPPKSLDRSDFLEVLELLGGSSVEDGAATLTALTAQTVGKIMDHLPGKPKKWLVCGGGRHNKTMMKMLNQAVGAHVFSIDHLGLDGDLLEAQLFAYLAVRSRRGFPLSFPTTTGVAHKTTGGVLFRAKGDSKN